MKIKSEEVKGEEVRVMVDWVDECRPDCFYGGTGIGSLKRYFLCIFPKILASSGHWHWALGHWHRVGIGLGLGHSMSTHNAFLYYDNLLAISLSPVAGAMS